MRLSIGVDQAGAIEVVVFEDEVGVGSVVGEEEDGLVGG